MKRRPVFAAAGLALALLAGCQTWQDKADSEALAECARKGDAEARRTCQTEVMTAAGDAERRRQEEMRQAGLARERQEELREAYGLPDKAQ